MTISQDLLDILACPKCKGKVTLKQDQSGFACTQCKLFFAIVDEIPNFLLEDARPLE